MKHAKPRQFLVRVRKKQGLNCNHVKHSKHIKISQLNQTLQKMTQIKAEKIFREKYPNLITDKRRTCNIQKVGKSSNLPFRRQIWGKIWLLSSGASWTFFRFSPPSLLQLQIQPQLQKQYLLLQEIHFWNPFKILKFFYFKVIQKRKPYLKNVWTFLSLQKVSLQKLAFYQSSVVKPKDRKRGQRAREKDVCVHIGRERECVFVRDRPDKEERGKTYKFQKLRGQDIILGIIPLILKTYFFFFFFGIKNIFLFEYYIKDIFLK